MRLTVFTDYSLRVLIYLAGAPEGRATIGQIAGDFGISEHHLVKVAHVLGREGVLLNRRGRRGGLRLGRPAREINVGEVVRLTEGAHRLADCFDSAAPRCALASGCRLQQVFDEAAESFYATLQRYTVADLKVSPAKLSRLLHFRPAA